VDPKFSSVLFRNLLSEPLGGCRLSEKVMGKLTRERTLRGTRGEFGVGEKHIEKDAAKG